MKRGSLNFEVVRNAEESNKNNPADRWTLAWTLHDSRFLLSVRLVSASLITCFRPVIDAFLSADSIIHSPKLRCKARMLRSLIKGELCSYNCATVSLLTMSLFYCTTNLPRCWSCGYCHRFSSPMQLQLYVNCCKLTFHRSLTA